ncbi:hypothetical protein BCR34DRAFT_364706 [Clohesyomyces aquaticus]|uniref:Major facilitator superfamily (MFS) profile domain-containing protein n=1 Tax=Clohesyomyces aquaticus TaxID=1231657 RepID=A0A1Y1ZI36_9PLEO|nr:hypothetical protein BCR34DRAFT_364706 [Clohesyomyces aquaticus]
MPLAFAVGRHPALLFSLILLFISGVLCATNRGFTWHLAARSVAGFSAAQSMALVLLIIQDIFFLHQRGRTFQLFSSCGVLLNSSLTIASSYMASAAGWRSWYWLLASDLYTTHTHKDTYMSYTQYIREPSIHPPYLLSISSDTWPPPAYSYSQQLQECALSLPSS